MTSDDRTTDRAGWTSTIDTLEATWRATADLCADLTPDEWDRPTDLPGWSVKDNLSHLVGIERLLQGLAGTPHQAGEVDHVKNPIGAANENEVDVRRSMSGADVLAEWLDIVTVRLDTLRNADDAYFDAPTMTPTGPGTVADFLHIRVLDCWMHEQDMRRALGRPGHDDGRAAEHTIDRLLRTIGIVVGKRAATPEGASVVIELTGPVHRTIAATIVDGRARTEVDGAVPTDPLVTVRMDSTTFVVLAGGRRAYADLAESVSIEGDTALGLRIAESLNMMI